MGKFFEEDSISRLDGHTTKLDGHTTRLGWRKVSRGIAPRLSKLPFSLV